MRIWISHCYHLNFFWTIIHSTIAYWPADLDWISQHSRCRKNSVWTIVCVYFHTVEAERTHSTLWFSSFYVRISFCSVCRYMCVSELLYICRYWDDQCCSYWTVRPDLSLLYLQTAPAPGLDQIRGCRLEVSWAEQRNEKRWNRCLPHKRERGEESGRMEISQLMTTCILKIQHNPNHKQETE